MNLAKLNKFHKTKIGFIFFGLMELAIAYIVGSRAWDTGSYWEYLLALIFLVGFIQNFIKLIKSFIHGANKAAKA